MPFQLDKVFSVLDELSKGNTLPMDRRNDRTLTPSHPSGEELPYSQDRALFTSIVEMHMLQIASFENCKCCKLQVLQIASVANCKCWKLQVLQIASVANFKCWKLQVLHIVTVANCNCCKLQLLELLVAAKNHILRLSWQWPHYSQSGLGNIWTVIPADLLEGNGMGFILWLILCQTQL